MSRRPFAFGCGCAALFLLSSCGTDSTVKTGTSPDSPTISDKPMPNFRPWTDVIAAGVGEVKEIKTDGKHGPVFVFQEYHTSRVGQLQIGVMLLRLHNNYGMKLIGLEGDTNPQKLDASWYQTSGGPEAADARKSVAARMLSDGEISSSEFMALEFPDVAVHGIETDAQYGQELNVKGNPEVSYLVAIAEHSISADDGKKVARLLQGTQTKKKVSQAFDMLLNSDPWVKQRYDEMKSNDSTSSEQMVSRLQEIKTKAEAVGAQVSVQDQDDLDSMVRFYETASQRSATMVERILQLAKESGGAPVAMIIGAAHSAKVTELLKIENVAFSLLSPKDLNPKYGSLSLEEFDRKSKGLWALNKPGTLGSVLNQRKPAPIIQRVTGHSYASMNLASNLIAKAARGGGEFPGNVLPLLTGLPSFRIDPKSIERSGQYDVIFRAFLTDDSGKEKEVWARVGTVPPGLKQNDLEQELLHDIDSLKGHDEPSAGGGGKGGKDGKKGGGDGKPPDDASSHAHDSDPDGTNKGGKRISRTGLDTLAVFGSKKEDVRKTGQISI